MKPTAPKLQDISVKRGEDITFSWKADRKVWGKWMKGDLTLQNGGKIFITEPKKYRCFNLTISNVTEEDEGTYTLELSTYFGAASDSAKVKVLDNAVAWREISHQKGEKVKANLKAFRPSNPEAQRLRFLLYGPIGAGKSSIVNSINSVFQDRIKVHIHAAPGAGFSETQNYKTIMIRDQQEKELSFVFNDIMGLESTTGGVLTADIVSALKGHIKDGYGFNTRTPLSGGLYYNNNPTLNDKVHCLVSVMPAHRIHLLEETHGLIMKMREVRDRAKDLGISHIVLMTHVDQCCPLVKEDLDKIYFSKKIKMALENCSVMLDIPMNRIFPVKNYHEENCLDKTMDCLILDALNTIVDYANDYVTEQIIK